jgi:hypothetical protein
MIARAYRKALRWSLETYSLNLVRLGNGGNAFHWGVEWSDLATALVRCIQTDGIEGRSYNLVDVPRFLRESI